MKSLLTILLFLTCTASFGQLKETRRAEKRTTADIPFAAIDPADILALDVFTASTTALGLVPATGTVSSTKYLRMDGTWAVPPGSGGGWPLTADVSAAGYTIYGNSTSAGNLNLRSTSHATKGQIRFSSTSAYDETYDYLGIGTVTPAGQLQLGDIASSYIIGHNGTLNIGYGSDTRFSMSQGANADFGVTAGNTNAAGFRIRDYNTSTWSYIVANANGSLSLNGSGGKVGIGIATEPPSTLTNGGSLTPGGYVSISTTYTATATDYFIHVTSGTFTITLPTATGITGRDIFIKNTGGGTITVAGTGGQSVENGSIPPTIAVIYTSIGTAWIEKSRTQAPG